MPNHDFVIVTSKAHVPGCCWGAQYYYKIGLLEVWKGIKPDRISEKSTGVVKIHGVWDRLYWGSTDKCIYRRTLKEVEAFKKKLEQKQLMHHLAVKSGLDAVPEASLANDFCAVKPRKSDLVTRYGIDWKKTGVSIKMPKALSTRFGYWEHGKTREQCREEIKHKWSIVKREEKEKKKTAFIDRKIHLVSVLCKNLKVTYAHARAAGLCDVGIRAYCKAHNLSVDLGAPISALKNTKDIRALQAIAVAAKELVTKQLDSSFNIG